MSLWRCLALAGQSVTIERGRVEAEEPGTAAVTHVIAALLAGDLLVTREAGELTLDLAEGSLAPGPHLVRDTSESSLAPAGYELLPSKNEKLPMRSLTGRPSGAASAHSETPQIQSSYTRRSRCSTYVSQSPVSLLL